MLEVYEQFFLKKMDWELFLNAHVRLFFFMIKEYICFIVHQNPGLYESLRENADWVAYETDIFKVMNDVRLIFANTSTNPLKQMTLLTQKLLPRPNLISWPNTSRTIFKIDTNAENRLLKLLLLAPKNPQKQVMIRTLQECRFQFFHLSAKVKHNNVVMELLESLLFEPKESSVGELLKKYSGTISLLSGNDFQDYSDYMFSKKSMSMIKNNFLPMHHVRAQAEACVKRHDLNIADESFFESLIRTTSYYFCFGCEDVKASYDYGQKKKENTIFSFGHSKLAIDTHTNCTYCMGTNSRRKQKEASCTSIPCIKLCLLGKIVTFFKKSFILCTNCGTICLIKINEPFLNQGMLVCGNCETKTKEQDFCGYCVRKSCSLMCFKMYNDVEVRTRNENPWSHIWLCPRHRSNFWPKNKILLKSVLFKMLDGRV